MKETKQKCENCEFYSYEPSILGGIAKCTKGIKSLYTFRSNEACRKFKLSKEDNLKKREELTKAYWKNI